MRVNALVRLEDIVSMFSASEGTEQPSSHSALGESPVEWEWVRLGDAVTRVGSGITPTGGARAYQREGRPFIRSQNVGWGRLELQELAFISDDIHKSFAASEIADRDVLLNITGASIGRSAVADSRIVGGNVNQHVCEIRTDHQKLDPIFLNYFLLSAKGQAQVDSFQAGGNRQGLNYNQVRSFLVPRPPINEQWAIAEALSDVDGLLRTLEALIAKKRAIKQAAMQQLLTGKTRLPGFTEEWTEVDMARDSVLKARIGWQGLTTAEYLKTGDYYLVTGTDFVNGHVNWNSCLFVDRSRFTQDRNIQLAEGDVLLTKDGTIGKAGYLNALPGPSTLNSGVFVIRPKHDAYVPLYMYFVLTSSIFEVFLARLQAGSTISHLYQKDFVGFAFRAPHLKEQTAIATVLSDMDAELAALEARRDKTRAVKQGMMQQLLTGRVRFVKSAPAGACA